MDMSDIWYVIDICKHISEAHLHIVSTSVLGLHQESYYIIYIFFKIYNSFSETHGKIT